MFDMPDFIDPEAWAGYVEMRIKIKAPMTDRAKSIILRKLAVFKAQGMDPNAILDQSTELSWRGVFPLREACGQSKKDYSSEWLTLRACIRDNRPVTDQRMRDAVAMLGGIQKLGSMDSRSLDFLRKDFEAALRQMRH